MILPLCCLLWHLATPAWAQETLSLKECREMALKFNIFQSLITNRFNTTL